MLQELQLYIKLAIFFSFNITSKPKPETNKKIPEPAKKTQIRNPV